MVYQYQTFDVLKDPLLACFNYSYTNGRLSGTQQVGLISLLLKQDPGGKYKDPVHLKNWRSLTLIQAKCIAHKIKRFLPDIDHPDQTGFLHG